MVKFTKDILNSWFKMKDMRPTYIILEIKIIRTVNGHILNQSHYVDKLLKNSIKMIILLLERQ